MGPKMVDTKELQRRVVHAVEYVEQPRKNVGLDVYCVPGYGLHRGCSPHRMKEVWAGAGVIAVFPAAEDSEDCEKTS